jgi:hypothetical protein
MPDSAGDADASTHHKLTVEPPKDLSTPEHTAPVKARRRWQLIRRGVALAMVALLIPTGWSYARALTAPGTDPWTARSVEWLRDHGMNGVVNTVEHWWFSSHAPPVGGKPKHGLPTPAAPRGSASAGRLHASTLTGALAAATTPPHLAPPANLQPLVTDPLPGEGAWKPTGRTVGGVPAVYTTFFRPDAVHTSLVAGAMWMDTMLLKSVFVVGLQEPGGPQTWGAQVPAGQRPALVAAFNSGFRINAALGGVYTEGQTVHPLVNGAASFVIDKRGRANVGAWGRDFQLSPDVATVRQNLSLIVDNGQPAPGLPSNDNGAWGATVGNKVFVWRSGVGVDRNGGLVYVAGSGLSAVTLAVLLERAGAVRAMELDINADWVSAFTFDQTDPANPAAVHGVKLLPDMQRGDDRYLVPGERDFFALLAAH